MNCPQCDALIANDCIFCPKCGERLQGLGADSFAELRESADPAAPLVEFPAEPRHSDSSARTSGTGRPAGQAEAARSRAAETAADDAVTLWSGQYSFMGMIDWLFLTAVLTVAIVAIAIWWPAGRTGWLWILTLVAAVWGFQAMAYLVKRLRHRYRLTPQTLLHEHGLLLKSTSPIEIVRIDDVVMRQSLLERLVGVGTIRILSKDKTDPVLEITGIPGVRKASEVIDQTRRAERRRRAVRVDAV